MTTTTATTIRTGTWALDPTHTEIGFTVRHLIGKVRGKFTGFDGTLLTADDLSLSSVQVNVDLSTIDTGTAARDAHLRSSDFFEVETDPTMTFVSTGVVQRSATDFVVTGDLTIRGITKSVELATELLGVGADPWGGTRVGIEATAQISRKEFGIDFNSPVEGSDKLMIGDKISIHINAQAVLQA